VPSVEDGFVLAGLLADSNKQFVFIYSLLLLKYLACLITIRLHDADIYLFGEE